MRGMAADPPGPEGASSKITGTLERSPGGHVEADRLRHVIEKRMFGSRQEAPRIGRYVLLSRAGSGGMGIVYEAYDPELDRKVAVKLLRPDAGESDGSGGRARLLREAQALARFTHPNVVQVYDTGAYEDQVYLVMEHVEGLTLRRWVEREQPDWRAVVDAFVSAGRGLAAAHAAGMVHRDFKTDNVLVSEDGRVLVVDFGLARAVGRIQQPLTPPSGLPWPSEVEPSVSLESPITQAGVVMGTPAYMPPEQRIGAFIDARSDQFSFLRCPARSAVWRESVSWRKRKGTS